MLFTKKINSELVRLAYYSDREVRADLIDRIIAHENDYTSNFTSALRRKIKSRNIPGLTATSYVLKGKAESKFGCDAAIILANAYEMKICLFEAKWPRFSDKAFQWDSIQTSSKISHFDDQLARQSSFESQCSIWEMIYCEFPFKTNRSLYPNFGSTCIRARDAIAFSNNRKNVNVPWNDTELQSLMRKSKRTIGQMISDSCRCKQGTLITRMDALTLAEEFNLPSNILEIAYAGDVENF